MKIPHIASIGLLGISLVGPLTAAASEGNDKGNGTAYGTEIAVAAGGGSNIGGRRGVGGGVGFSGTDTGNGVQEPDSRSTSWVAT